MFTGIIQELGTILEIRQRGETASLHIRAPKICSDAQLGDSICVNGVCLTISFLDSETFTADLSTETLNRSTFLDLTTGDLVNLESALRPTDRMGGHIVAGHVDGIGTIDILEDQDEFSRLVVQFPPHLAPYIAEKGSITIDGISLTLANVEGNLASVALIPYTIQHTNLRSKQPGDAINLEVDILARYVERLLQFNEINSEKGLTMDKLEEYGFLKE